MPATPLPICATCGMQYSHPRPDCPVCEDERQYVPAGGQRWTDLEALRSGERTALIRDEGEVLGIGCEPGFAIGQRALLLRTEAGNFLWDCLSYLDDEIVETVNDLGGLAGIAISHPHYYTTVVEWARAFDAPVHLHASDQQWIGRPDPAIQLWEGTTRQLAPGLTLLNLGVHFAGGTVLHWERGAGSLFSGDIVQVIPDRTHVAFMYSYPNYIPERPSVVRRAARLLEPYRFEALYGAWWGTVIPAGADRIVQRSAERYLRFATEE
ncbi:MBL fold metallo-hydrolase [Saccharopolyspora indica]|uniref:MBL fold metallo-hydrolase n=1 Tax=Saccharopolyspora indica TaxID=1229659 RepID=UPI0022EAA1FC|nr:MBL fold metallo-hydrolase [Saccharopolyspora indica]MDA3645139.1 MBL fold metallo-hydrolase [Saccharopolyspora indica]